MSGKPGQLCRFYSRGKVCRYGDTCQYQHTVTDLSDGNTSNLSDDSSCPHIKSSSNLDINIPGTKNESITLQEQENQLPAPVPDTSSGKNKQKTCGYFAKQGWCAFGKRCRFLHDKSKKEKQVSVSVHSQDKAEDKSAVPSTDQSLSDVKNTQELDHEDKENCNARKKEEKQVCNWFERTGRCRYGAKCHFLHVKKPQKYSAQQSNQRKKTEAKNITAQDPQKGREKTRKVQDKQICHHFQRGYCKSGERCRFWHPMDVMDDLTDRNDDFPKSIVTNGKVATDESAGRGVKNKTEQHQANRLQTNRPPFRPVIQKISIDRNSSTDEDLDKLRKTEIVQLQKRFPRNRCTVTKDGEDGFECRVLFSPSDPDWPFDVKKFDLLFTIPPAYPQQMLTVTLPLDQDLPETVRRYLEVCVVEWVTEKSDQLEKAEVYEVVFRPFLKWMDKNLETNVTEALRQMKREMVAKVAGFEFINASELQKKYQTSDNNDDMEDAEDIEDAAESEDETDEEDEQQEPREDHSEKAKSSVSVDMEPEKKGTEMRLKNLQVCEGAATLLFEKIHIVIQCGRCKNRSDFTTPAGRINSIPCSKCNETQLLTFRPALLHQFNSVLGYLDLDNCTAFDLLLQESAMSVGCLNCSKESKLQGIVPGQLSDTWCRHCHQKMRLATESVRFAQLQPSGVVTDPQQIHQIPVRKLRVQKDVSIQEGKPLPEYGACKHYKKSYRWFRFPCCGMIYPCDICHEEKSEGHDMVFANRIICGFCCKEQPYAPDKPCVMCLQMTTRGKSAHWEGGLGCRDKIKMGRNDNQKYSNMSKTISKHAQKLKETNSKKKIKLRHA